MFLAFYFAVLFDSAKKNEFSLERLREHSHKRVHAIDSEHEPDYHDDDHNIDDRADWLE